MKELVAFFSWSGHTLDIAAKLAKKTRADLFRIEREIPYSTDYNTCAYTEAKEEADRHLRPAIRQPLPDLQGYDAVILAFPIWWYGAPQAVLSYLQQVDMSGKQIVFFGIHRGSGLGGIPEQIQERQPNARVIASFTVECQTDNEKAASDMNDFHNTLE